MMTYEMIKNNLGIGFFIESRDVRAFDSHRNRAFVFGQGGQYNQKNLMDANLWNPLKALVNRLKTSNHPATGKPFWDYTTIVLCSEMGRSLGGEDDDVCKHWEVSSTAFLGGTVKAGTQFGRVGTQSLEGIPMLPTGALDPNYDANTGMLLAGKSKAAESYVSDAGHVYATALACSGIAAPKGKNARPAMQFVKK